MYNYVDYKKGVRPRGACGGFDFRPRLLRGHGPGKEIFTACPGDLYKEGVVIDNEHHCCILLSPTYMEADVIPRELPYDCQ